MLQTEGGKPLHLRVLLGADEGVKDVPQAGVAPAASGILHGGDELDRIPARYYLEVRIYREVRMSESAVTTKGQVTIPKAVRDRLRISAGDRVSFVVREDGVVELRPSTVDLKELVGTLAVQGKRLSVDEMDEAIRRGATGA